MKLSELLKGVSVINSTASPDTEITGVCYDSRKALPGCLFVAVEGFSQDGHKYIPAAAEKGASVCVVTRPCTDLPSVTVSDSRLALAQIAANFYRHPEKEVKMIGVTGTNGKTTTCHMIRHILEENGIPCGLIGTLGTQIRGEKAEGERTTPDSLELFGLIREMADKGCRAVVMEVSAHGITLKRVAGINYNVAIFTNLSQDHLDFYGDMESYFEAKARLFETSAVRIFNYDDDYSMRLYKRFGGLTYSSWCDNADLVAKNIRNIPGRVEYEAVNMQGISRMSIGVPGAFTVSNSLAAVSCALSLGIGLGDISAAVKSFQGVPGRVEVVETPGPGTVIIDYAHTPDGVEKIIRAARGFTEGRVITLMGCGGDRDRTKRPIMGRICTELSDIAVITSDNPRTEDPAAIIADITEGIKKKAIVIEDRREAIKKALSLLKENDTLLLLGKGHETYQEINGVKHHLDEREEVAAYYRS